MKLFVAIFLIGLAIASAVPLHSSSVELRKERALENIFSNAAAEAEKEISLDEVKKQLKERMDDFLKKIKDAFRQGKFLKDGTLEKFKEIQEKFKDLSEELKKHGKDILGNLKGKGKEFLKKLLEKLGVDDKDTDKDVDTLVLDAEGDFDVEKLKEKFNELVKRVKDAFEQGKSVKDALDKLQELRETLKLLNIDLGEKGKEYLEILKQKVKDYWKKLLEKLNSKRSADIDIFGILEELKREIREKFDVEKIREFLRKYLGENSELKDRLLELLKENGEKRRQKILDFLERLLGKEESSQRSISDVYEKIRDYFRDLNIELKEKFVKFGEWVKNQYEKGLEKGKSKAENIRKIAKEFLKDTKSIGKDMADEALEFFREYKKELGNLYDELVEKVRDVIKKDDTQSSISDVYNKVKEYFRELNIDLKEKFVKFGEWVKNQYEKGLEKGKTKAENIRKIAEEFLKDTKSIGKDMADEALEFFREYKKDLGNLYDELVEKVRDVIKKDDTQSSISDVYNKVKEYFRELNIELKEKFVKFGQWVKNQYEKGLEKGKTKAENIKRIAKEFLKDTHKIGKDMAEEALEFFREYKRELGNLYNDLADKVHDIMKS